MKSRQIAIKAIMGLVLHCAFITSKDLKLAKSALAIIKNKLSFRSKNKRAYDKARREKLKKVIQLEFGQRQSNRRRKNRVPRNAGSNEQSYSGQLLQDKYVHEKFFRNYRNGIFVDIGANDGVTISNSHFFEKNLGWTGLCIEPLPHQFSKLQSNRTCICIQGCVSDINGTDQLLMISSPNKYTEMLSGLMRKYHPDHLKRVKREIEKYGGSYKLIDVQCHLPNDLFENYGISHVNFLTIDTEGGEFDILKSIDFSRFTIDVIVVEDPYHDTRLIPFLAERGLIFFERLKHDVVFVRENFSPIR